MQAEWQTISHGDYKAGNIFVKKEAGVEHEICVIDWQWTGWNMTMHDVLYFFSTTASHETTRDYIEALRAYHEAFLEALPDELLVGRPWPFEEHLRLFKLATLDYMRWALSYRMPSETPEKMKARAEAVPVDANQGEYRRSLERISWLLERVEEFLPVAESGDLGEALIGTIDST